MRASCLRTKIGQYVRAYLGYRDNQGFRGELLEDITLSISRELRVSAWANQLKQTQVKSPAYAKIEGKIRQELDSLREVSSSRYPSAFRARKSDQSIHVV